MTTAKRILIVEDEMDTRIFYGKLLSECGYKVELADSGPEGLEMAKKGGYDLVLLDLMMPIVDGMALLTELRKNPPKVSNGPIIVMTNISSLPVLDQTKALGAVECVVKSGIDPDQLVDKVKGYIG